MRSAKKLTGILLFVSCCIQSFSQEQLGLRTGNYSGIHGTMLNPAFNVRSPLPWDVNLIAAGAFAENNYILIKDASPLRIMRNRSGFTLAGSQNGEAASGGDGLEYDFTTGSRKKAGYLSSFATAPSAMFHIRKHTFGIFFNVRSVTSANRIPASLGYYDLDALETGDVLHVKPLKMAGMAWSEAGINYGRNIFTKGKHVLDGGVTLKFLQGYEAFFFHNHEPTSITIHVDSMTYESASVTYALASGVTGYGDAATPYDLKARGYGASGDIGVMYYIRPDKKREYDWKLGFALLDFGKIVFSKDAQVHSIVTDESFAFVQGEYEGIENFSDVFRVLSDQSLDNPDASRVDDRFSIWTPAGVSLSAERAITHYFYINAAVVRRLRFPGAVPERDNIWSLTPRLEHRWFELSVPLVLYNDRDIRLGTAIRLGPLVIGSDNLTGWFGSRDFSGSDFYFALKINSFARKKDDPRRVERWNKSSRKQSGCYEF